MSSKLLVITPADRQPPLAVLGTHVTVLTSDNEPGDQRITLQTGAEGTGPPPHSHVWDESFFVSGGLVEFTCAGETTMCAPGTFVHVPGGTVHSFAYGPGGGEIIEITGRGSQAIEMFSALAREMPPGPPDLVHAVQVLGDNGVRVHL